MSTSNLWEYPDNDSDETLSSQSQSQFQSQYHHQQHQQHQQQQPWWQEPIVVGYAFGPKKMSTMGVVMAEASRAEVIHEEQEEDFLLFESHQPQPPEASSSSNNDNNATMPSFSKSPSNHKRRLSSSSLTPANLQGLEKQQESNGQSQHTPEQDNNSSSCIQDQNHRNSSSSSSSSNNNTLLQQPQPQRPHTIISMTSGDMGDIKHIVRYFRSSCSSAAGSITETTVSSRTLRHFPVRISFVPLDPNIPLEEQHGGNFDLILHKLTEDILSLAMSTSNKHKNNKNKNNNTNSAARTRVQSLLDYKRRHEFCCMVDDPNHVRTLMSRSDISKTLQHCLQSVTSASGHPVRAPKHVVVDGNDDDDDDNNNNYDDNDNDTASSSSSSSTTTTTTSNNNKNNNNNRKIRRQLTAEGLQPPLIVKPLIAAGTKQSHYMTIVLNESAVDRIPPKSLVQQYVNHDATLYKVYVMGEYVHVYRRPSLPNLPTTSTTTTTTTDLVEFDSQRPYPRLQDFGYDCDPQYDSTTTTTTTNDNNDNNDNNNNSNNNNTIIDVTPEEVRPIVEALKQAFGLELFGFDILISQKKKKKKGNHNTNNDSGDDKDTTTITSSSSSSSSSSQQQQQQEWLVVDVNYFPSYKEVPNFPALLAQYLTNRVLNQRRKTLLRRGETTTTDNTTTTSSSSSSTTTTTCTSSSMESTVACPRSSSSSGSGSSNGTMSVVAT